MKAKTRSSRTEDRPSEAEIREYAHHLYVSSGWLPGRDLDNWLQAEAHLIAERKAKHARRRPPRALERVSETVNSITPELPSSA